LSRKKRAYW